MWQVFGVLFVEQCGAFGCQMPQQGPCLIVHAGLQKYYDALARAQRQHTQQQVTALLRCRQTPHKVLGCCCL